MQHISTGNNPFRRSAVWRSVVRCIVAYALVIGALLSGVLQAEWFTQVAAGLVGERCMTDARAAGVLDPAAPAAPAGQPDDSLHCGLCTLTAGSSVKPTPDPPPRYARPQAAGTRRSSEAIIRGGSESWQ